MSSEQTAELIRADLIVSGKAALDKGRTTLAESQFRSALEQCQHFEENDSRTAETLMLLAKCIDLGLRRKEAEDLYRKIIAIQERATNVSIQDSIEPLETLAFILFRKGDTTEALHLQNKALARLEDHFGKYSAERLKHLEFAYWNARRFQTKTECEQVQNELILSLDLASQQINDLDDRKQYEKAWALAEIYDNMSIKEASANILLNCLQHTRDKFDANSLELAQCLLEIASTPSVSCENAIMFLLEGISILDKLDGCEPTLLKTLKTLSELYSTNNKLEQAILARLRVIELKEQAIVCDKYAIYPDYQALASLYVTQKNFDSALKAYKQAIAIIEETNGSNGEDLANLLKWAAHHLDRENKSEAEDFYKRALEINENIFGFEHAKVADALTDLGGFYLYIGSPALAEPLFLRALTIVRNVHGDAPQHNAYIILSLGQIYSERNDLRAAEEMLKSGAKAAERLKNSPQPKEHDDSEITSNHFNKAIISLLANVYLKQAKFSDAKPLLEEIAARETEAFGDNARTFNALFNVAFCNHQLNNWAFAEAHYKRCLSILDKASGQQAHIKDSVIDRLVEVLRSTNKHIEANELASFKSSQTR